MGTVRNGSIGAIHNFSQWRQKNTELNWPYHTAQWKWGFWQSDWKQLNKPLLAPSFGVMAHFYIFYYQVQFCFQHQQAAFCFHPIQPDKPTLCYLPGAKEQMGKICD